MSKIEFPQFAAKFPPVAMPVTLGEDDHHTFGTENEPLSDEMIAQFIHPIEPVADDEFTEYVPCFAIEDAGGFIALVYWKAALLTYEYVLATFSPKGECIARRVIARTAVTNGKIVRTVSTIDAELTIFIAEGQASETEDDFDPTTSKTYTLEIMPNGEVAG